MYVRARSSSWENGELRSVMFRENAPKKVCSFEYVYFARTDSRIDGRSVYLSRREREEFSPGKAALTRISSSLFPIPVRWRPIGYAEESGIPFGEGLVKNRYVGRTFIQPTQEMRELSVRMKLNVLEENVRGKRIIMIDDSIVRGTTSGKIVRLPERCRRRRGTRPHQFTSGPLIPVIWESIRRTGRISWRQILPSSR